MTEIQLPFGAWLPDQADYENPGLVVATNVQATPRGYVPFNSPQQFSTHPITPDTGGRIWGGIGYFSGEGSLIRFDYGDRNALYVESFATAVPDYAQEWHFAQMGDRIFAVREGTPASTPGTDSDSDLYYHLTSDLTWTNITDPGLCGKGISRVGDFLVLTYANANMGASEPNPFIFRWSAFNDPVTWTPTAANQAGAASVDAEYGVLTGVSGGRYGILFQERGVTRIDYVGPPKIWNRRVISEGRGCIAARSIVRVGDLVYFLSHDGPCVTDGASVQRIGQGEIDEEIKPRLFFQEGRITSAYLPVRKAIIWSFLDGFGNEYDAHFLYSLETGTFTFLNSDFVTAGAVPFPAQARSAAFGADYVVSYATDGNVRANALIGDTLAAEMTTGHFQAAKGRRIEVDAVEPVYTGSGATAAISTKQTLNGSASATGYGSQNSIGVVDVRASGRSAAVSVRFPAAADWDEFRGVIVNPTAAGTR